MIPFQFPFEERKGDVNTGKTIITRQAISPTSVRAEPVEAQDICAIVMNCIPFFRLFSIFRSSLTEKSAKSADAYLGACKIKLATYSASPSVRAEPVEAQDIQAISKDLHFLFSVYSVVQIPSSKPRTLATGIIPLYRV